MRRGKKITFVIFLIFLLIFFINLIPEKLNLPPIDSFKLVIYSNDSSIDLEGAEKEELYEILNNIRFAWRPLKSTPDRFQSGEYISVLGRDGYFFIITVCSKCSEINHFGHFAFISQYKGIHDVDRVIINDKELVEFLKKYY